MSFTVFSCGVLYERLAPGGLAAFNIGAGQTAPTLTGQGDYLADIGNATAEIVETNAQGSGVLVSMTSVYDVARFVAAAVEIGPERWPREFRMRGDQLSVRDIVGAAINVRGGESNRVKPSRVVLVPMPRLIAGKSHFGLERQFCAISAD